MHLQRIATPLVIALWALNYLPLTAERGIARHLYGQQERAAATGPVLSDERSFTADVSRDGRTMVLVTYPYGRGSAANPSRLEIRDVTTKRTIVLAGGDSPAGSPGRPAAVFSPDASQVAYTWLDTRLAGTGHLNVISTTEGATPRTVVPADASDRGVIPHGWSPDGRAILALIHGASDQLGAEPTSIAWVSAHDGTIRTIKTLEAWRDAAAATAQPRVSPDGQRITYSAIASPNSRDRAIYIMDANGENEREIKLAGSSTSPVWTQDGRHIVFVNTQANRSSVLALPTATDSRIEPLLIAADLPTQDIPVELIAISTTGTLFYRKFGGGLIATVAERAPATGRVLQTFTGYGAAWVNATTVAFIRRDAELVVRSITAPDARSYVRDFLSVVPPRILSAGTAAVLFVPPPSGAFHRVDLTTGQFVRLFARDSPTNLRTNAATLSPDDKTLYLPELTKREGPWGRIVAIDLATADERTAVTFPHGFAGAGLDISPDGRMFAVHAADGRIVVMTLDGRHQREIVPPSPGGSARDLMRWTPDGRQIVFVAREEAPSTGWRLMRVPAAGGRVEFDGIESAQFAHVGGVTDIDVSPDGLLVVFSMRTPATYDVWALSDSRLSPGR